MNGLTALLLVMLLASIVFASASMSATSMISPAGGRASAIFAGWEKWALTPASSLRRVLAWAIWPACPSNRALCRMTVCRRWARLSQMPLV